MTTAQLPDYAIPKLDPKSKTSLWYSFNFESYKRNNIHFIEDHILVLAAGNTLHFFNINDYTYRWIEGNDEGIGAIAVSPNRKYIAVAEKGDYPKVRIYNYPELQIIKELEKGTTKAYSAICFNNEGTKLATVGSDPDYMLTIWNWNEAKIILRYKAHGQDVFNVTFSPTDDGQLTTSGMGHIKFWKMAQTFTGLKLQGSIGKFGKLDISDIAGYVELPDGKVLSGCENGDLLLWEGNLIKVQIRKKDKKPCHDGMIETIMLEDDKFITAGLDGYIKFWDFEEIDLLEGSDNDNLVFVDPIAEFKIGDGVKIRSLIRGKGDLFVLQDAAGALWKLTIKPEEGNERKWTCNADKMYEFHAGSISDIATSPNEHIAVTAGMDGTLRVFDYVKKMCISTTKFSAGATCIRWNPDSVDSSGRSITVGFNDGVLRVLKRYDNGFQLVKALKPHTKAIRTINYSIDGKILVTGSDDCTLFFFKSDYSPIGFTRTPAKIVSVDWQKYDALMIILVDGTILEMPRPNPIEIDTSTTYEFTTNFKEYSYFQYFQPPKKEKPKKDDAEGEEDEESKEEEEEEEEKEKPPENVPVLCGRYNEHGEIYLSLQKPFGVFVYSGQWWKDDIHVVPEYPSKCITVHNNPVSSIEYSSRGRFLIMGSIDGKITLNDLRKDRLVYPTQKLHDSIDGRVNKAITSFDDSYLLSVDESGCFFVQSIEGVTSETAPPVSYGNVPETSVEDITDPNAWSIQEAREMLAKQERERAQEDIKRQRLNAIEELRKEFLKLLEENEKREPTKRLQRKDLQIDTSIHDKIDKITKAKLEEVKRQLEYEAAEVDVQLKKLKDHYIDNLDLERAVIYAFKSGHKVYSFRTKKIYPELRAQIELVHSIINEEINRKKMERESYHSEQPPHHTELFKPKRQIEQRVYNPEQFLSSTGLSGIEKSEELKEKVEQRKREKLELLAREPKRSDEDPIYNEAIKQAQKNIGDYKLKTDPDYAIGEHQRVTAAKKKRQMIILEESTHALRMVYNSRFVGLRDLKRRLVNKFMKDYERIKEINEHLGIKEKIFVPELKPEEFPENRSEISQEELENYRIEKRREEKRRAREAKAKQMGVGVMDLEDSDDDEPDYKRPKSVISAISKKSGRAEHERLARITAIPLSDMEKEEQEMLKQKLLHEKKTILKRQEKQIESFDNAVHELRREQFKLEGDLKNASLKLLLLYAELRLLKDFEKMDNLLMKQLVEKRQEKADIVQQIVACQDKLAEKKYEIDEICSREKIINEFVRLVPEDHPAYNELFKIFKSSKIKEERNQSDSDSDSEIEEEEEEEEDEVIEKPENCSEDLFNSVLQLRKKRLDQDRQLDAIAKSVDALKRDRDALVKKEKACLTQLQQVEAKLQEVQKQKQQKMNELPITVVLKFVQIQCLLQNKLPADLSDYVVFSNRGLEKLGNRIKELNEEKKQLARNHRELIRYHKELIKRGKIINEKMQYWEDRVREVQLLKFGQEVDLELLENSAIDKQTEEMRTILRKHELIAENEIMKWKEKVNRYKEELTLVTQENTKALQGLIELRQQKQALEKDLNLSQSTMVERMEKNLEKTASRKTQYKDLVLMQAQEINACKNEIAILRSKGTHVFTPMK